jgi:hypothetical protein
VIRNSRRADKTKSNVEFEKALHLADRPEYADAFSSGVNDHPCKNHGAANDAVEVSDASGRFQELKRRVEGSLRKAAHVEVTPREPWENRSKAE